MSDVYTAERIIAKKKVNGITLYHIKWKGYSNKDNTWEPVHNIIDRNLLMEFEKKEAKKRVKRSSTNSINKSKAKDLDDRENSINNNPPATTSKIISTVTPPPASPRLEDSNTTSPTPTPSTQETFERPESIERESKPVLSESSQSQPSTSGQAPENNEDETLTIVEDDIQRKVFEVGYTRRPSVTVDEIINKKIDNDDLAFQAQKEVFANSLQQFKEQPIATMTKNRRLASRIAILNTIITDVTVHDQTITISESKTNQGFFKEVSRHSVAVDTNTKQSADCIDIVE